MRARDADAACALSDDEGASRASTAARTGATIRGAGLHDAPVKMIL